MTNPTPTLAELIERATPGPWTVVRDQEADVGDWPETIIFAPGSETSVASTWLGAANGQPLAQCEKDAQLIARCNPATMRTVLAALDVAYCTIHNALEAERTSEAPITEQCHVFIDARRRIKAALRLLSAPGGEKEKDLL